MIVAIGDTLSMLCRNVGFLGGCLATLAAAFLLAKYCAIRRALPLPPGPPPKLLSGNVHQLPISEPWKVFTTWSKMFNSSIVYYRIFGHRYMILNTVKSTLALLEGRSAIYSDRPTVYMLNDLVERKMSVFTVSSQHPRHKVYRKMLHSGLNPRAVKVYAPLQECELRILLQNLLQSPESFMKHFRRNAGAVVLQIAYGWTVSSDNDYFVSLMEDAFRLHRTIVQPGRWLVEVFPILRFLPAWLPGAYFKRYALECRERMKEIDRAPFQWTKEQIASGSFAESFTSQHLLFTDGQAIDAEQEEVIRWCSAALYAGGADTTASLLLSFLVLMMKNPEVQRRAQEEIDSIVGDSSLVTIDDQEKLPYLNATIKEILRFAPPARLGLPHRVIQDDEYQGYRIPSGTTVMANIWAICRDPAVYPNPETFSPERFLTMDQLDPRKLVFGYGRRVCPGAHFAEVSVFLIICNILSFFDIRKPFDANGEMFDPLIKYTTGVTSHPEPFPCRILPRQKPGLLNAIHSEV